MQNQAYHLDKIEVLKNWLDSMPREDLSYGLERLGYFQQELFKYANFKSNDIVEISKDMNLTEDNGWFSYRHHLTLGCKVKIVEIDHYKGTFRYSCIIDLEGLQHGTFAIREEYLKPIGWDQNGNPEKNSK